jgi:hypothetical protein
MANILVMYELGSASPMEIVKGLSGVGTVVFAIQPSSTHAQEVLPLLRRLGHVVSLSGDLQSNVGELKALGIAGIVTFSDDLLRPTATLAQALGISFHSPRTALVLTDKFQQRTALHAHGVDHVICERLNRPEQFASALERTGLPAVS